MKRLTQDEVANRLRNKGIELVGEYTNKRVPVEVRCLSCGHTWAARGQTITQSHGCPVCRHDKTSAKNRLFNRILSDFGDYLEVDISTGAHPDAVMLVDADVWERYMAGDPHKVWASGRKNAVYACYGRRGGASLLFHHFVLPPCDGLVTDHIAPVTDKLVDNRRCNLRRCSIAENNLGRRASSERCPGVTGVRFDCAKGTWNAQLQRNGKLLLKKRFHNMDEAIAARLDAEAKYFGEFGSEARRACINLM